MSTHLKPRLSSLEAEPGEPQANWSAGLAESVSSRSARDPSLVNKVDITLVRHQCRAFTCIHTHVHSHLHTCVNIYTHTHTYKCKYLTLTSILVTFFSQCLFALFIARRQLFGSWFCPSVSLSHFEADCLVLVLSEATKLLQDAWPTANSPVSISHLPKGPEDL